MTYVFTWEREEHKKCRHEPAKDVTAVAHDGRKISFCRHCNYIVYYK